MRGPIAPKREAPIRLAWALTALIAPAAATAAAPIQPPESLSRCTDHRPHAVDAAHGQASLKRLDQLPPAAEILTVLRREGQCERPVVVRYGIAGNPSVLPHEAGDPPTPGDARR